MKKIQKILIIVSSLLVLVTSLILPIAADTETQPTDQFYVSNYNHFFMTNTGDYSGHKNFLGKGNSMSVTINDPNKSRIAFVYGKNADGSNKFTVIDTEYLKITCEYDLSLYGEFEYNLRFTYNLLPNYYVEWHYNDMTGYTSIYWRGETYTSYSPEDSSYSAQLWVNFNNIVSFETIGDNLDGTINLVTFMRYFFDSFTLTKAKSFSDGLHDGYQNGYNQGYNEGDVAGFNEGHSQGYSEGYGEGELAGYENGYNQGYNEGDVAGFNEGHSQGYSEGYGEGELAGYENGYNQGYNEGDVAGFNEGHSQGYSEGYGEGELAGKEEGYADGYDNGYIDGEGDGLLEGYTNGYNQGYTDGDTDGYNNGYNAGNLHGYEEGFIDGEDYGYDTGFGNGQADMAETESSFKDMVFAIFDAPVNLIDGMLNFDIFGINLAGLVKTVLTLAVVALIVFAILKFVRG